MKKTKIICTMGPTTDNLELLVNMMHSGMDLARFNFSHGSHPEQAKRIELVRAAAKKADKVIALICDTKGPEMRLGLFKNDKTTLQEGHAFCLTTDEVEGDADLASVNYANLPEDVKAGDEILLNDGKLTLRVERTDKKKIYTTVTHGGEISSRKRVAVPGAILKLPFMSKQDVADITFAAQHEMDYVAASFVRSAADVLEIKKLLEQLGSKMGIIAKIENSEGINNIESILEVVDGVMVARGDLGVEIPAEDVPVVQKEIIAKCNKAGKPVVTATQMLESMITNYRATRAEASDVANAIYDGTDVIMLSGETASGSYPLEAVQTMARIAERTEAALDYAKLFRAKGLADQANLTAAISHATVQIAQELEADAIMTITESGYTARMIAKYRPQARVVGVSPVEASTRRMQLYWGVTPLLGDNFGNTDELIENSLEKAKAANLVADGEAVVVTAGMNVGKVGSTNLIKVINMGKEIAHGVGLGKNPVSGVVCKVQTQADLAKFQPGQIMVVAGLESEMAATAAQAAGIIAEEGGFTSPAAIVGINCSLPVIVGATGIMQKVANGSEVTMDVGSGSVYAGKINVK